MRRAQRPNPGRQATGTTVGQPAPVRGWNVRDRLESVDLPDYASVLDNWIPEAGRITLRRGFVSHATGLGASAKVFLPYSAGGASKLFVSTATAIYDATEGGPVGAAAVSSLTNGEWVTTMFATSGGQFLVGVNGADGVRTYNGSSWATQSITGVSAADLSGVAAHRSRLWFIQKNTLTAWYLNALAIAGTATEFPLGAVFKNGGTLLAIATWTRDGGSGPGDLLAFITTSGEIAVYDGTNPDSASTFGLVGIFKVDRPIGKLCTTKNGGDLLILTRSGVVSMGALLPGYSEPERVTISELIRPEFIRASVAASMWGWSISTYGTRGWIIVNVPATESTFVQFVFSTLGNAWWRAVGMNGVCWQELDGNIYFATAGGTVYRADVGTTDDSAAITSDVMWAFSRYGTSNQKKFEMVRPIFTTNGSPRPAINVLVDFDLSEPTTTPQLTEGYGGTPWGSPWGSPWTAASRTVTQWVGATGMGHSGAVRMKMSTKNLQAIVSGVDVMMKPGGPI